MLVELNIRTCCLPEQKWTHRLYAVVSVWRRIPASPNHRQPLVETDSHLIIRWCPKDIGIVNTPPQALDTMATPIGLLCSLCCSGQNNLRS